MMASLENQVPRAPFQYGHVVIPQTPTRQDLDRVLTHLTGQPADPAEIASIQEQLNVAQQDYAPGGETTTLTKMYIQ